MSGRNQGRGGRGGNNNRGGNFNTPNNGGRGPSNRPASNPFANNQPALVQQPRPFSQQQQQPQQNFGSAKQPFSQGQNRQYQPRPPQSGRGFSNSNPFSSEPSNSSSGSARMETQGNFQSGFNKQPRPSNNAGNNPFAGGQSSSNSNPFGSAAPAPSPSPFGQQQQSPFAQQQQAQIQNTGFRGFGSSSSSMNQQSGFGGQSSANPFAANNPQSTPFGQPKPSSFGTQSSSMSPFGQQPTNTMMSTNSGNPFAGGSNASLPQTFSQRSMDDDSMGGGDINIKNVLGLHGEDGNGEEEEEKEKERQAQQAAAAEAEEQQRRELEAEAAISNDKLSEKELENKKMLEDCLAYMEAYPLKEFLSKKLSDNPWEHRTSKKFMPGFIPEKCPPMISQNLFDDVEDIFA